MHSSLTLTTTPDRRTAFHPPQATYRGRGPELKATLLQEQRRNNMREESSQAFLLLSRTIPDGAASLWLGEDALGLQAITPNQRHSNNRVGIP